MCAEDPTCKSILYDSGTTQCKRYDVGPTDIDQNIKLDGQGSSDL